MEKVGLKSLSSFLNLFTEQAAQFIVFLGVFHKFNKRITQCKIISLFTTSLINNIIQEHECYILLIICYISSMYTRPFKIDNEYSITSVTCNYNIGYCESVICNVI